jgi:C-terminal processing protease CtpA/Prc
MVGRLRNEHLIVIGVRSGYGWRRLLSSQNDDSGLQLDFSWTLKANADHYSFFDRGIPVLMLHTGLHDDYHRPSDVAERINSEGMTRVTRLLFAMLYELADRPAAVPGFRAAARHETPETEKALLDQGEPPADRLGVGWNEDAAVAGGVFVARVTAGSPAERAGVREGDCIVRFAGRDIRSDGDFFAAVATAESRASLTLRRPGAAKPLQLKLELPGSPLRWGIAWRVDDAEPGVVILTRVVPGTPAARADLRVGDRIYQIGGRDFADETAFLRATKNLSERLPLLVERNGRMRAVVLQTPQAEPAHRAA